MVMIVEQTKKYRKRMRYNSESNTFFEDIYDSLAYARGFNYPYGWIKESGTPPEPHFDVFLMSDREVELGDEVKIKIIGVFYRGDGDHKFIAVEEDCVVNDLFELTEEKLDSLYKLYPSVGENEGWRGRASALYALENEDKAL